MRQRPADLTAASLKRRLLSGGAWALGGKVVTALTVLTTNALLARILSPQDLGTYFLAFSVVLLGATVGSLGLNQAVVRFVAESMGLNQPGRARRIVYLVLGTGTLGALGAGVLYLAFGRILVEKLFDSPALAAVSGLIAGWIVVMILQNLMAETFRGFHDIRLATAFSGMVTGILLTVCLGSLWLLERESTLTTVLLLAVGSGLASALLAGSLLRRKIMHLNSQYREHRMEVKEVMLVAWPLLITSVTLFVLTQADLWVLGVFRPQEEVAVYGAAVRLVTLVAMPLFIVNSVVPPLIAEMYAQGKKRELERTIRATATLAGIPALLVLVLFIFVGSSIMGLVFGDYYRGGAAGLELLSIGQLANVWAGSCGLTLLMTGRQVIMMALTIACGVITVAVALGVVEQYGAVGVAVAAATGLVLQNVSMWLAVRFTVGMWTHIGFFNISKLVKSAGADQ